MFDRTCLAVVNRCWSDEPVCCDCADRSPDRACCVVIDSLAHLHQLDLYQFDVVICSMSLRDGNGLDALVYIQGMRSELAVILTGGDASLAVEAIRAGAVDFIVTTTLSDLQTLPLVVEKGLVHQRIKQENERLHGDLKRSLNELAVTNHQLQAVIRQLETMARTDELTGLANRRWLNLMLQGSWAEATRNNLPLACLMIDLDGFKALNDRMGHQRGDEVLRLASKVIRANSRAVDVPARYGGDEFCVLMAHTDAAEAMMVAERILREFRHATRLAPEEEPPMGMSIGVSHINLSRPINADQLMIHADEALYAAKQSGKNRVVLREATGVSEPRAAA